MSNFHLQEIQSLQNSLREREEYVIELENRLRALWDKYDGDRKHYNDRIKRLEEAGDAALNYSIGLDLQKENDALKQRIKRLEELGHKLRECASQIGWTSSEDPRWLKRAEAAVEAWDKEAKP